MLLRHVHLSVGDVNAARDWYTGVLGMQVIYERPNTLVVLAADGECQLGLEAKPTVSEPDRISLIFRVPDVDAATEKVRAAGVTILREPTDEPYGHRVAIFRDNVGHTINIYTPLPGDRPYD